MLLKLQFLKLTNAHLRIWHRMKKNTEVIKENFKLVDLYKYLYLDLHKETFSQSTCSSNNLLLKRLDFQSYMFNLIDSDTMLKSILRFLRN